jgi:potassium-transporting ATPase KdpC subunit
MWKQLLVGLRITMLFTILTGLIYPGVVSGLCQVLFPSQAHGSLIVRGGKVVGSSLIGQNFSRPEYFHPRPSAAGAEGYDASASGGSNLGPTSQKLMDRVKAGAQQADRTNAIPAGPALEPSGGGVSGGTGSESPWRLSRAGAAMGEGTHGGPRPGFSGRSEGECAPVEFVVRRQSTFAAVSQVVWLKQNAAG